MRATPWLDDPPECPECSHPVTPGEDCDECETYYPTDAEMRENAEIARYEALREEGLA